MPVFEVVIVQKPTKKEAEDGGIEKLLYGPKAVVAKDAQAAAIGAVMGGDLSKDADLTRIDVTDPPFQRVTVAHEAEARPRVPQPSPSEHAMRAFQEQRTKAVESPQWQTLTTAGSASYQPTIVNSGSSAVNFSAASLTNRA